MGFLDYLSPALTTATQAVNAWQSGDQQRQREQQQQQLELLKQIRQKKLDEQAQAYQQMQMTEMGTRNSQMLQQMTDDTRARQQTEAANRGLYDQGHARFKDNPVFSGDYIPGHDYGKEFDTATGGVTADTKAKSDWTTTQTRAFSTLQKDYPDAVKGLMGPDPNVDYDWELNRRKNLESVHAGKEGSNEGVWVSTPWNAPDGTPLKMNNRSGVTAPVQGVRNAAGPGQGGGATQQSPRARLLAGLNEGALASQRMEAFEAKYLKNGRLDLGGLDVLGADIATSPTGHGGALGDLGTIAGKVVKAGAQSYMAGSDKRAEVQQYLRDAQYVARAEQLMSARGGTEAMASATADLARAPANATAATVLASQRMRRSIFGRSGSLMQTMTPDQINKIAEGFRAMERGGSNQFDFSTVGDGTGGTTTTTRTAAPPSAPDDVDEFIKSTLKKP